jgi:hypothetical protein
MSVACGFLPPAATAARVDADVVADVVPTQLVAKAFTAAWGRLPAASEWKSATREFTTSGCSERSVGRFLRKFYVTPRFDELGYDEASRLLALFRGVLNRDPDQAGLAHYSAALAAGASWPDVVDEFLTSPEFTTELVPRVCGPVPSYGWGSVPAPALPTSGEGFVGGSGAELQVLLNQAPPGSTVWLAQKAPVRVDVPLVVPAGVTLATVGNPGPSRYAAMARLVRNSLFAGEVVRIMPGARLDSVWVDGQRSVIARPPLQGGTGVNLWVVGGSVVNSLLAESSGWTSIQAGTNVHLDERLPDVTGPCHAYLAGNLVTAYASSHDGDFSDGISSYCDNTLIERNQVVDTTDVGIIIFPPSFDGQQRSQVRFNTVVSAGNSGYGAYAADATLGHLDAPDFTGSSVHDNAFWTGGRTHFDIGLAVGTRAWFGSLSSTGIGASFTGNGTGGVGARVAAGVAVSGMSGVTVTGNVLQVDFAEEASPCPRAVVGASVSAGYASGSIQPYADVLYESCITTGR